MSFSPFSEAICLFSSTSYCLRRSGKLLINGVVTAPSASTVGTTYSGVWGGCILYSSWWAVKYIYLKQGRCKVALKGNQLTIALLSLSLHLLLCKYHHRILVQPALWNYFGLFSLLGSLWISHATYCGQIVTFHFVHMLKCIVINTSSDGSGWIRGLV